MTSSEPRQSEGLPDVAAPSVPLEYPTADSAEPDLQPRQQLRRMLVVALALVSAAVLTRFLSQTATEGLDYALIAAVPFALIGPVRRRIAGFFDRIRSSSRKTRILIGLAFAVAAPLLALGQAVRVGRELVPHWHDEHSYVLQAQQLAHFRLWYDIPPGWPGDFFESFHISTADGWYGSVYWPGAAMMNVPGVWLGLPTFVMPLVLYGLTVAMIYLLTARILDNVAGILAGLLGSYVLDYYSFSTRIMAQVPTALLGALLLWTWLRWRAAPPDRRLRWVALMGVLAGWLAITRPVDGLAFAIPVAATVLFCLVRDHYAARRSIGPGAPAFSRLAGRLAATAAVGISCTLPFIALQLYFNHGTTGDPLLAPFAQYIDRNHPGFAYGSDAVLQDDALLRPQTTLPQKTRYYELFIGSGAIATRNSLWAEFVRWRLPTLLAFTLPGPNFVGFAFAGLAVALGLYGVLPARDRDARVPLRMFAAVVASFMGLYVFYALFLTHYMMMLSVATIPLLVAGLRAVEECGGARMRPALVSLVTLATLFWFGYSVWNYPSIFRPVMTEVRFKHEVAPQIIEGPALVLVRYRPGVNFHNEPVYNSGVAFPDEARIVWAHELGGRTGEILHYYAERQPERQVYLIVRPLMQLHPMGSVQEALETFDSGRWPLPPPEVMEREVLPGEERDPWRRNLPPPLPLPEDLDYPLTP